MTDTPLPKDTITTITHSTETPKKTIELTLAYYINVYKVTSIVNSTYYRPGMWMTADVAQKCCDIQNWKVTMVDNDLLASLMNFGVSAGLSKL